MRGTQFFKIVFLSFISALVLGGVYVAHGQVDGIPFPPGKAAQYGFNEIVIQSFNDIPFDFRLQGVITSIPEGATVHIIRGANGGYMGYILKNNTAAWFGIDAGISLQAGYAGALRMSDTATKQIPCVSKLLGKPRPNEIINLTTDSGNRVKSFWGYYDQLMKTRNTSYDFIAVHPTVPQNKLEEVVSHEATHWINGDCGNRPLCETTTQMIERCFSSPREGFVAMDAFMKKVAPSGVVSDELFINSLRSFMSGFGKAVNSSDSDKYILSSLLGEELADRFNLPNEQAIIEVQKRIDVIYAPKTYPTLNEQAEILGFRPSEGMDNAFENMGSALKKRFFVTGGIPNPRPFNCGIKTVARGVLAGAGAVAMVPAVHDFVTTSPDEIVLKDYFEAMRQCEDEAHGSKTSFIFNFIQSLKAKFPVWAANLGYDDAGRLILPKDRQTGESILDTDFKKQVEAGFIYMRKNCPIIFSEIKNDTNYELKGFKDALWNSMGRINGIHDPLTSELRQAPANWWMSHEYEGSRNGPSGSGGKLK